MAFEILSDSMKKCNINYVEGCKYIALNGVRIWSAEFYVYNTGVVGENEGDVSLKLYYQEWDTNDVKQSSDSSINADNIHLIGAGSGSGLTGNDNVDNAAWVVFSNVDVTDMESVSMTFDFSAVSGGAPAIIAIADSLPGGGAGIPQNFIENTALAYEAYTTGETNGKVTNTTITCNISGISGKKNIIAMTYAGSYNDKYYSDLYIHSIKLE